MKKAYHNLEMVTINASGSKGLTVGILQRFWLLQTPKLQFLQQQQLQAIITTKSQDENSTDHLLLHHGRTKLGTNWQKKATLPYQFLYLWFTYPFCFSLQVLVSVFLNFTIKYTYIINGVCHIF